MNHNNNNQRIRHNGPMGNPQTYGESPASGPAPTTAGHHKHDVLNKLDPRVDSTQDHRPLPQKNDNNKIPAGTYGPHSSRMANILDPRVDSDMSSQQPGTGAAMHGGAGGAPEGTYGPHRTRMGNAMDPRADSDMDGRGVNQSYGGGAAGYTGATSGAAGRGYGTGSGAGANHMTGERGGVHSGPGMAGGTTGGEGPHKSGLMNKLDPRVDSKTGMMKEGAYEQRRGI